MTEGTRLRIVEAATKAFVELTPGDDLYQLIQDLEHYVDTGELEVG